MDRGLEDLEDVESLLTFDSDGRAHFNYLLSVVTQSNFNNPIAPLEQLLFAGTNGVMEGEGG